MLITSNFPASFCSLVELSADSESQKLPSQSLSNLAHLSLVCLKHSTVFATYSGDFSSGTAEMEMHLFEAVVELLLAWKAVANGVLSLLLHVLSGNVLLPKFFHALHETFASLKKPFVFAFKVSEKSSFSLILNAFLTTQKLSTIIIVPR